MSIKPPAYAETICRNCPLLRKCKGFVFSTTSYLQEGKPPILIVGQSPGDEELEQGKPFVGRTSLPLIERLQNFGYINHCIFTNALRCSPQRDVGLDILRKATTHCSYFLEKDIKAYRPMAIILLGDIAARAYFNVLLKRNRPPRNEIIEVNKTRSEQVAIWTYHPAAAYRDASLWNTIEEAIHILFTHINKIPLGRQDDITWEVHTTKEEMEQAIVGILAKKPPIVAIDLETGFIGSGGQQQKSLFSIGETMEIMDRVSLFSPQASVLSCAISTGEENYVLLCWRGKRDELVNIAEIESLRKLLLQQDIIKVFHNALFEQTWIYRLFGDFARPFADTKIMAYVLNEAKPQHAYSLKSLAVSTFNISNWVTPKVEEAIRIGRMDLLPSDDIVEYNAKDAYWTARLYKHFIGQIKQQKLDFLLEKLIYPLVCLYALATHRGIKVNYDLLNSHGSQRETLLASVVSKLDDLQRRIKALSRGKIMNPRSWQQKQEYLFGELGLQLPEGIGKETTNRKVLEQLLASGAYEGEIAELLSALVEFSRAEKIYSSYLSKWQDFVYYSDEAIRPEIKFWGTETGRISLENPPFHNFPSERTELGRECRKLFIPRRGYCFFVCDASQFEVRVVANKSGDEKLIDAFLRGRDIYLEVASIIFGKPVEHIDRKRERTMAKQAVLGIIYGISEFGLARTLGISLDDAVTYLRRLRASFPKVFKYMESVREEVKEKGYVRNWFGRYRRFGKPIVWEWGQEKTLRQAANFVIQSEASDWWQWITLWFYRLCKKENIEAYVLATIHDSLLAEVQVGQEEQAVDAMKKAIILVSTMLKTKLPIDGEYAFFYEHLGEDKEKIPLEITANWGHLQEEGLALFHLLRAVSPDKVFFLSPST